MKDLPSDLCEIEPGAFSDMVSVEVETLRLRRRQATLLTVGSVAASALSMLVGFRAGGVDGLMVGLMLSLWLIACSLCGGAALLAPAYFRLNAFGRAIIASEDLHSLDAALTCWENAAVQSDLRALLGRRIREALSERSVQELQRVFAGRRAEVSAILRLPLNDPELTIALIQALKQGGGEWAIAAIRDLMWMEGATNNMRRIRTAARECLPYLLDNARVDKKAMTLLRASNAPGVDAPDTLLRAVAQSAPVAAPEQLLRPHA